MVPGKTLLAISLIALLVVPVLPALGAGPPPGCFDCSFGYLSNPTVTQLGAYTEVSVLVTNDSPPGVSEAEGEAGLVYAIVHDSQGQVVANSTGVFDVGVAPANETITTIIMGLNSNETYSVTLYGEYEFENGAGQMVLVAIFNSVTTSFTTSATTGAPSEAVLGSNTVVLSGTPSCQPTFWPCEEYTNYSNSTVDGIVFLVLHNQLGQTTQIASALVTMLPGQQVMVTNPMFDTAGLASVFVVSTGNVALSSVTTVNFGPG